MTGGGRNGPTGRTLDENARVRPPLVPSCGTKLPAQAARAARATGLRWSSSGESLRSSLNCTFKRGQSGATFGSRPRRTCTATRPDGQREDRDQSRRLFLPAHDPGQSAEVRHLLHTGQRRDPFSLHHPRSELGVMVPTLPPATHTLSRTSCTSRRSGAFPQRVACLHSDRSNPMPYLFEQLAGKVRTLGLVRRTLQSKRTIWLQ